MAKAAKKSEKSSPTPAKRTAGERKVRASRAPEGKKLVVVESPAKAKTINRYLGTDFIVKASMGHVRDLPGNKMGVDLEHDFTPTYEPLASRRKVLAELKQIARRSPEVFLATDLDREGEAIAWHLAESLGVPAERIRRVLFNEITAGAIREAFAHPRQIDMDKVNAQQARRILDRIVGYEVSPLLWRKVARGLSAGRVQTVAVRLIVEREREIDAFQPEEYWRIGGVFTPDLAGAASLSADWAALLATRDARGNGPTRDRQQAFLAERGAFRAELATWKGQRFKPDDERQALEVARALGLSVERIDRAEDPKGKGLARNRATVVGRPGDDAPPFVLGDIKQRETRSRPYAPFTTASLQQAASVQLRFSASRTMRIAQQLYEGVELPGEGSVGLITYMRTDSRHLSAEAVAHVRKLIDATWGPKYVPEKPNFYSSSERAQEAHEAIRPTDAARRPQDVRGALSDEQYKLYELIWTRFVSCQMPPAVWKVTEADILADTPAGRGVFRALGRTLAFDGFLKVAGVPSSGEQILPPLQTGGRVAPVELLPTQHFTQAPPRYTETSLVKALEADGIGRPSTYASIIQTIQDREYVRLLERAFHPTDLGIVVTEKLVKAFPVVFDVRFTADLEDRLDQVEETHADWVRLLREFYGPFHERLVRAGEEMTHARAETSPSEYTCPECGKPMVYRFSRNGRYLACTGYPDCKQTHPVDKDGKKIEAVHVDLACPNCSGPMVLRRGRFGPFLSCEKYPDCKGVVNLDRKGFIKHPTPPALEVDVPCPKCGANMNLRRSRRGPWLSCSKFPKCRGRAAWTGLDEEKRKALELLLMNHEKANPVSALKHLDGSDVAEQEKPRALGEPAGAEPAASADDETPDTPEETA